jgi:Tfp pilus assembly protein FimT
MIPERRFHAWNRGFTTLELVTAIAVTMIVGAFCVKPIHGLLQRIKLQNAADGIKHYVLNARIRSVANPDRQCGVVFRLHPGTAKDDTVFAFLEKDPSDKRYVQGQDSLYLAPLVVRKRDRIRLSVPTGFPTEVVFRGDGSASVSARIAMNLNAFNDTLDILASTGRVKVVKH